MTKSGCASGNTDGSNNLNDDSYNAFADYLTEVVKHYRDTFGITFRTLEALNEPNATWWTAKGGQEGCHFSPANQQTIIKAVAASLATKGLTGTTVSASDENSIDDGYNNMRSVRRHDARGDEPDERAHLLGPRRHAAARARHQQGQTPLGSPSPGPLNKTLADDTDAAVFMAGPDHHRPARSAGRGLGRLASRRSEHQLGELHPQRRAADVRLPEALLHARRFQPQHPPRRDLRRHQRHRHGRRGERRRSDPGDRRAQRQHHASAGFTFDLTALASVGTTAAHRTSRTENLVSLTALPIQGWSFVATVAPYSITTFVVPTP